MAYLKASVPTLFHTMGVVRLRGVGRVQGVGREHLTLQHVTALNPCQTLNPEPLDGIQLLVSAVLSDDDSTSSLLSSRWVTVSWADPKSPLSLRASVTALRYLGPKTKRVLPGFCSAIMGTENIGSFIGHHDSHLQVHIYIHTHTHVRKPVLCVF